MAIQQALGILGENIAAEYLQNKNYRILQRNWRYKRVEIDIIASIPETLVFVEVKTRHGNRFGEPENFVDHHKEKNLEKVAEAYLEHSHYEGEIRFDIIAITFYNQTQFEIHHIEDAFFPD